jgi:hypothetical protein
MSDTSQKIIIRAGRTGPTWSAVPDWIMFAGYSVQAQQVYKILKAHCNTSRGDGLVWPTQTVIAMLMKGSRVTGSAPRGDKIRPYIAELAADLPNCDGLGGAVTIEHTATMPRRTIYTVHDAPPAGYTGPLTLADWYRANSPDTRCTPVRGARRREQAKTGPVDNSHQVKPQVSAVTPERGRQPRPGQTPVTAGQPSHPPQGVTGHPPQGVLTRRTQPDEPTNPQTPTAGSPTPGAAEHGAGRAESGDQNLDTARRVFVEALAQVPQAKQPGRAQTVTLIDRIAAALDAGWSPTDLVARLGQGIASADRVAGALRYRLDQLPDLTRRTPAAVSTARPPHCGRCYEPTRMDLDDTETMVPCTRCHPDQVEAS